MFGEKLWLLGVRATGEGVGRSRRGVAETEGEMPDVDHIPVIGAGEYSSCRCVGRRGASEDVERCGSTTSP